MQNIYIYRQQTRKQIILRINKKRKMQSRIKKYKKSFDNDEQAIEKQLIDDFQVYEYLNQNKLQGNNIEQYSKLYNTLLVSKSQKRKKYELLHVNFIKMSTNKQDKLVDQNFQIDNWLDKKHDFKIQYDQIKIKVSNQIQVKNNLWKEILQTKKSLNLLKGDIGHFISRNQSAQILQNKISKVKIVADDQLKRVNMAYLKDKDEIKLRDEMQKKFSKKLSNVSIYQDTTLGRLKRNYLNSMVRKKQIHDKLNYIQKLRSSIIQSDDLQYQKNLINKKIIQIYESFKKLKNMIERIPMIECEYGTKSEEIHQFSRWLRSQQNYSDENEKLNNDNIIDEDDDQHYRKQQVQQDKENQQQYQHHQSTQNINNVVDLQSITRQQLSQFQIIFFRQYQRLNSEIQSQVNLSNFMIKKSEQLISLLQKYDNEIEILQMNICSQLSQQYIITKQMRQQYSQSLQKLIKSFKVIFFVLEYIEKQINYTSSEQVSQQRQNNQTTESLLYLNVSGYKNHCYQNVNKNSSLESSKKKIHSEKSFNEISRNFISELHKTYSILTKDTEEYQILDSISQSTYNQLQSNLNNWFRMIKQQMLQGNIIGRQNSGKPISTTIWSKIDIFNNELHSFKSSNIFGKHKNQKQQKYMTEQDEQCLKQQKQYQQYSNQNNRKNHTIHREDNIIRHLSQSYSMKSNSGRKMSHYQQRNGQMKGGVRATSTLNIVNINKLRNTTLVADTKEAIRIKLLKDLDKDYYKMLKSTLKMEKENTRKNYQFLRTFKRAKYSSRDQILQEKRFQCSFSMLFTIKKPEQTKDSLILANKKSNFFRSSHNNNESRIRKSRNSYRIFESRLKSNVKNDESSTVQILKENIKKFKEKNVKVNKTNVQHQQKEQNILGQMRNTVKFL